jgi:hypothetical protein
LKSTPDIRQVAFTPGSIVDTHQDKYDIILFCHSMYGMKPKSRYLEQAIELLEEGGTVVIFHRDGDLQLAKFVCSQTANLPTGFIRLADKDEVLNCFTAFVAGFVCLDSTVQDEWRQECRASGRSDDHDLLFSAPEVMATFTRDAARLPELLVQVPELKGELMVKNREARLQSYASIVKPATIQQIQQCVRWALKYGFCLNIIGGGHSDHCLWQSVVSVDMGSFDNIAICMPREGEEDANSDPVVVVEAGCKTGDIIRKTMAYGITVPLGSRPSVGAGLWLQGGIGHLARLHGMSCDSIIGAIVVSASTGDILCIGSVPTEHCPSDAIRPDNESDWLWAIRGAGTNFGVVISVTFKTFPAHTYSCRDWVFPLRDHAEALIKLDEFDRLVAKTMPQNYSADAYLFSAAGKLHLGVTVFEASTTALEVTAGQPPPVCTDWGTEEDSRTVDGVELFDAEMYMSRIHGGHAGGKTSSFKRCVFLKDVGGLNVANRLIAAVDSRPTLLCYLRLLHGGGAVSDNADAATAFGCRD